MQRSTSRSSTAPGPRELLEVLVASPLRLRITSALADGPLDLRDLADRTNAARTTLRHNLDRLLAAGLLEQTLSNQYRVTARGRVATDAVDAYRDRVVLGLRLEPFLEQFPLATGSIELPWLDGADLTVSEPSRPGAAGQRLLAAMEAASDVVGLLPCLPARSSGRLESILGAESRAVTLLIHEDLQQPVRGVLEEIDRTTTQRLEVAVLVDPPEFGGLLLDGERVLLLVSGAGGNPTAAVETADDRCVSWFEDRVDRAARRPVTQGVDE